MRIVALDQPAQVDPRIEFLAVRRIVLVQHEPHIGDYAQQVTLVTLVNHHRLFVIGRQQDFGTPALAQHLLLLVERLFEKLSALLQHQLINCGQVGRVITDRIFDQQDRLHAHPENIVVGVHPVLDQLDDRQDQVGVAVPAEDIVNRRTVFALYAAVNILRQVGQQHERNFGMQRLELFREVEYVEIPDIEHTDNQVKIIFTLQQLQRLGRTAHPRERRRVAQVQLHILVVELHLQAPVLFEGIGIIAAADQQNPADAPAHQVTVVGFGEPARAGWNRFLCHVG